jgi:hypothetical protein
VNVSRVVRRGSADERWELLQAAAVEYVVHGWGVLPGPVCDGVRYSAGHCERPVEGLVPVLPSARTVRNARAVWSWWNVAAYGILARAGEAFDVICAPTALAVEASGHPWFPLGGCPVAMAPDGARFLVRTGAKVWPELVAHRVRVAERGEIVALPPTRVIAGAVTWWVRPEDTRWRLGDPDAVQAALWDTHQHSVTVSGGEGCGR